MQNLSVFVKGCCKGVVVKAVVVKLWLLRGGCYAVVVKLWLLRGGC